MRRRDFITGVAGASAWPLAARAQQSDKVRRIGVIMGFSVQNSEAERRVAAFERKLAELGWKDGIDLQIEYRWPGNPPDRLRADIAEILNEYGRHPRHQRANFVIHVGRNINYSDCFCECDKRPPCT